MNRAKCISDRLLEGKTAIVTGASSGIGRAAALALAENGANVALAARRAHLCAEIAERINRAGGNAIHILADVTDDVDVDHMIEQTLDTYGQLDLAFNNAGVLLDHGPLHEMDDRVLDQSWDVNVRGVWLCMKAEIRAMMEHGNGVIVNDCSRNGLRADFKRPAYTATKHAVAGLTKAAALDYARMKIRVNAICPGPIDTEMMKSVDGGDADARRKIESSVPIGRYGSPEEVAQLVVWLMSERASYISGQMIGIDGGLMAR